MKHGSDQKLSLSDSLHGTNALNEKCSQSALEEITSMIVHKLRNPLGGIKGFASLLERDLKDQPDLQRMVLHIIKGADHLDEILTHIQNYARSPEVKRSDTDLVALIRDIPLLVYEQNTIPEQIKISVQSEMKSLIIPIDPGLVRKAFIHLTTNAIQAMPSGGKISISLKKENASALITITDSGEGIPPANMNKIFSPFFTTRQGGCGFGLTEVKKIIRAHKGSIEVDSTENEGATFTIRIPL
jgi:signal transduction histidine kinase